MPRSAEQKRRRNERERMKRRKQKLDEEQQKLDDADLSRRYGFNTSFWDTLIGMRLPLLKIMRRPRMKSFLIINFLAVFPELKGYVWHHPNQLIKQPFNSDEGLQLSTNTPCGNRAKLSWDYRMALRSYNGKVDDRCDEGSDKVGNDEVKLFSYATGTGISSIGIPAT